MTTVREARVKAAVNALNGIFFQSGSPLAALLDYEITEMGEAVVDVLFPPDPLIDNAVVPDAQ